SHPPRNVRTVEFRISILTRYVPAATLMVSPESAAASPCSTVLHGVLLLRQAFPTSLPRRDTQRSAARLAAGSEASEAPRTSVPSAARMIHPPLAKAVPQAVSPRQVGRLTSLRALDACARASRPPF